MSVAASDPSVLQNFVENFAITVVICYLGLRFYVRDIQKKLEQEIQKRHLIEDEKRAILLQLIDLMTRTGAMPKPKSEPPKPVAKKLTRVEKALNLAKRTNNPHEAELATNLAKEWARRNGERLANELHRISEDARERCFRGRESASFSL